MQEKMEEILSGETAPIPIYEETYPVFSFLLDPMERLSIPAIFGIVGDAAGRDATRRGWGYPDLASKNQAWVLLRSKMIIHRQPVWGEQITLRTWPKLMEGITAYRDFQILCQKGEILLAGSTVWTLIDRTARKPVRLNGIKTDTGHLATLHAIEEKPARISWPHDLLVSKEFTAEFGHLDMNNHVNNSRYIEWALNSVPEKVLLNKRCTQVEVNFINEVKLNDMLRVLVPETMTGPGIHEGFIINGLDGRQTFAARFTFV